MTRADISIQSGLAAELLSKALREEILTEEEANILMDPVTTPLDELISAADILTRRFFSNRIDLCAIYAAQVGHCSGDCAFCAQSVHNNCEITPIRAEELNAGQMIAYGRELKKIGVRRLSLVTSGERLTDAEFEHILNVYHKLYNETGIGLCASLGSLDEKRAARLIEAGVTRYHHNIETSRSFFPKICTTHDYGDKIETIKIAKQAGMEVCSGGIISMGETPGQRVEMAFALRELDVDCVPVNILNPVAGTRLEHQELLNVEDILRTIAVFRLILQNKTLRFAGGREHAMKDEEYRGYTAGINGMIIGDYLTTRGKAFKEELKNMEMAGFVCKGEAF